MAYFENFFSKHYNKSLPLSIFRIIRLESCSTIGFSSIQDIQPTIKTLKAPD